MILLEFEFTRSRNGFLLKQPYPEMWWEIELNYATGRGDIHEVSQVRGVEDVAPGKGAEGVGAKDDLVMPEVRAYAHGGVR